MVMISQELARIVAHIAGDGYIGTYSQRRSPKELLEHPRENKIRKRWRVRYVNTEPALVRQFIRDVKKEFNRKVVAYPKHEYEIGSKRIYTVVKNLGALKSHEWFIPQEILSASDKVKIAWLQAFFDDESHVSMPQKRIVLNMVNVHGLKQVQSLLREFGIDSTLTGQYSHKQFLSYHLSIYRDSVVRYAERIGFYHPKKKAHLAKIVKMGVQRFEL